MQEKQPPEIFWMAQEDTEEIMEGPHCYYDEDDYEKTVRRKEKNVLNGRGRRLDASESSFTTKRSRVPL